MRLIKITERQNPVKRMREKQKGMYPADKQARKSLKKKTEGEQGQKEKKLDTQNAVSIIHSLISLGSLTIARSDTSSDRVHRKEMNENDNDDDGLCL